MIKMDLLKNKNFLGLYISGLTTYLADAIVQVALIAYIMSFGGEVGSSVALIMFFFMLPSFLLAPVGGVLADKISKNKILFSINIFKLIVVSLILIFGKISTIEQALTIAYSSAFLAGIGAAFYFPAYLSSVPNVVKAQDLQKANSLTSSTVSLAILIGGVISGTFIVKYGINVGLSSCVLFYLISSISAFLIKIKQSKVQKTGFKQDFKKGINYLKEHQFARNVVLLSFVLATITASFFNVLNAVALDYYHLDIAGLSELKLMLGVGVISGSLFALLFSGKIKLPFLLGGAFLMFLVTLSTIAFANTMERAWFWLIAIGAINALISITLDTLLQKSVPDSLRGKVFGVRSSISTFVFVTVTLLISFLIKTVDYFVIFKCVAIFAGIIAILIMLFDKMLGYLVFRLSVASIFRLLYPVKIEGREFIPQAGGVIFAGNHTGWWDSLILICAVDRPIWFLAGPYVFQMPILKHIIKIFNVIPITPAKGEEGLTNAVIKLQKGGAICIFPEGSLTKDGQIQRFRKGVSILHKIAKTPIIPFAISGGYEAWSWGKKLPRLFTPIWVQFGQNVDIKEKAEGEIADEIQKRVKFMKESLERRKTNPWNVNNFLDVMQMKGDSYATRKALSIKEKDGSWAELSYIELSRQAKNFANYLIENGIEKGERMAILSESRPEFGIAFFASIQAGTITVPLDVKLTIPELASILSDCSPCAVCVSNHYLETALEIQKTVKSIKNIYVIEEKSENEQIPSIFSFKATDADIARQRSLDETALIVYTSGTTGNPKGVMISFGNILSQMRDFEKIFKITQDETLLSILPINHLLELNVGFNGMLYMGAKICYVKALSPKSIAEAMKEKKVTYMIAVPLFVKVLKAGIDKEIKAQPENIQRIFHLMLKAAPIMPLWMKTIAFKKIHDNFGNNMKGFISGGAPLDIEVAKFFENIGIPVYQGYGLTETSPTLTTNYPKNNKLGSVGKALPSVKLKISDTGEILACGDNLMQGYYGKPGMTKEVIDKDGWFHTGDIGYLDNKGYLYITGRIKNMIVLGGGKKIFPEEVEAILEKSELIKEICVLGLKIKSGSKAGTEEVGAIVVPADNLDKKSDEQIQKLIENAIKQLSKENLASYKEPTAVLIRKDELPKTATRKVKRKDLLEWYENLN